MGRRGAIAADGMARHPLAGRVGDARSRGLSRRTVAAPDGRRRLSQTLRSTARATSTAVRRVTRRQLASARHTRAMGLRLEKYLAPDWRILHSLPLGDGASIVDHLVIGSGRRLHGQHPRAPGRARVGVPRRDSRQREAGALLPDLRSRGRDASRRSSARRRASACGRRRASCSSLASLAPPSGDSGVVVQEPLEGALVLDSSNVVRSFRKLDVRPGARGGRCALRGGATPGELGGRARLRGVRIMAPRRCARPGGVKG